jgi:predicted O-linked N-acetylglucosamine transferase (SPINDLY family)
VSDSAGKSAAVGRHWALALGHYQAGRLAEAERACQGILEVNPDHADALHLLGAVAHQGGRHDRAVELIEAALRAEPSRPDFLNTLGVVHQALGGSADAEDCFRGALSLRPDYAAAHNNLGIALRKLGRPAEAESCFHEAVRIQPDFAEAHNNLGNVQSELRRQDEAERSFRNAIQCTPDFAEAHGNLGILLRGLGRLTEAEDSTRKAIALRPDYAEAYNDLGVVLFKLGRQREAEDCYRKALALDPGLSVAQGNLAYLLNCLAGKSTDEILAAHREYARRFCPRPDAQTHENSPEPERRLRIGYVSADLRRHSVAYFIEPVLARHDHGQFEIFGYSNSSLADAVTGRIKASVDQWRDVFDLDDASLTRKVREDRIDILVDLGGFSANNRLSAFARKPAPLMATWLGYPTTTGLAQMDYRISDWSVDPEGSEGLSVERVVRLTNSYFCYGGPGMEPDAGAPPASRDGRITFGSFNSLAKIGDETARLWVRVLQAVPGSRLLIKSAPLAEKAVADDIVRRFEALGLAPERLTLSGWKESVEDHLQAYRDVDIGLDSFPYNGATTTCEALWMGVPVVSLAGETHASRMGHSILHAVGLDELVARTQDRFAEVAIGLARDPGRLSEMRAGLRERMRASPLMDAARFTRNLESAYRRMWRTWCDRQERRSLFARFMNGVRKRFSIA